MAKQTFWQKLKERFGGKSAKSSGSSRPVQRASSYYSRGTATGGGSYRRAMLNSLRGKDDEDKPKYKSMAEATKKEPPKKNDTVSEFRKSLNTAKQMLDEDREKSGVVRKTPKDREAYKAEQKELRRKTGTEVIDATKEERAKARARLLDPHSKFEPEARKFDVKHHKVRTSAERGIANAVTLYGTNIGMSRLKDEEQKEAEEFYQRNKSKGAELAGELAGSLVTFGGVGKAVEKPAAKIVGSEVGEKAVEKLAASKLTRATAKRAIRKAGGEATEDLVKTVARRKAENVAKGLTTSALIDATAGNVMNMNIASSEHEVGSKEWWDAYRKATLLNAGISGVASLAPVAIGGRGIAKEELSKLAARNSKNVLRGTLKNKTMRVGRGAKNAAENLDEAAEAAAKPAAEAVDGSVEKMSSDISSKFSKSRSKTYKRLLEENPDIAEIYEADKKGQWVFGRDKNGNLFVGNPRGEIGTARVGDSFEGNGGYFGKLTQENFDKAKQAFDAENFEPFKSKAKGVKPAAEPLKATEEAVRQADDVVRTAPRDVSEFKGATDERLDIPVENQQETRLNDARAEAEARAREIASGEEPHTKSTSQPELETEHPLPKGSREIRQRFDDIRGTNTAEGKAASTDEIYDAFKDYHISQGEGEKTARSRAAASMLAEMDTVAKKEAFAKWIAQGGGEYEHISTPELYDKVVQEFEADAEHWMRRLLVGAEDLDSISVKEAPQMYARAQYVLNVLDPKASPDVEDVYLAAMTIAKDLPSKSGQVLNLSRNFASLTPAGRVKSTMEDLYKIVEGSIGFNEAHPKLRTIKGKYNRMNYIKGVLMDDPEIKKAVTKIADAKNSEAIEEAYAEILLAFNKNNPKSVYDVVQEWRYFNMLANPKTHIRNVFGSGFFAPIRQTSNMFRSAIESHYIDKGFDIVRHGGLSPQAAAEAWTKNPKTEAGKAALEAFERRKGDILGSSKFGIQKQSGRATTAGGKLMDAASDFNSKVLTQEDDFFRTRAFKENFIKSYNRYTTGKNAVPMTEKLLKRIEDEAIAEAEIATFNEYNAFANWLNKITRNAYNANASRGARWGGRALNAFIPFEKVPSNLMKQSINYSPIGIGKGFLNIRKAVQAQDAAALNRAIDEFASGLTGTGIFGLGMLLGYTTDAFTTNTGKKDPAAKHKKLQGVQNYSVTYTAPNGKKKSVTLDWLVPNSSTFFAGVEMANQMRKGGIGLKSIGESVADWATVSSRLIEPVMDSSMLSGLHSTLETLRGGYGDDDTKGAAEIILREGVQNWIGSLFPTFGGQVARTAYSTDKQMPSVSDQEYFKNSLKVKTGLAADNALTRTLGIEPLGADTDAYGNVKGKKEGAGDYVKSFIGNAVLPWNTKDVDLDATDEQILAEYEQRVKNGENPEDLAYLFPKKQTKLDAKIGGENEHLSNKELSLFNQAKTTGGEEGMRYALEGIMFNRYDYDSKGKKVPRADAYTKEEKEALMQQFKGKSMREVQEWLYAQPEFQNATEAERKKVLEGLWGLNKDTKAVASQRVGGQAVYEARGKDVNEYNFKNEITESKREALLPFIESGLLTYEEAVDFARNGGKVSYTEDEDGGGSATTYYTKAAMIDYFVEHGIPYDKAEALYNAFKAKNAKPYSGNNKSSGRSGYRRRGGGYHRSGGGKSTPPKGKSMAAATRSSLAKGTKVKLEPPSIKMAKIEPPKLKDYEI